LCSESGRLFHARGMATAKAQSPIVEHGTGSSLLYCSTTQSHELSTDAGLHSPGLLQSQNVPMSTTPAQSGDVPLQKQLELETLCLSLQQQVILLTAY